MKAKEKKRIVSRKKSTKPSKTKSVSTKRTSKQAKSKKRAADSAKPVKNSKTTAKHRNRFIKGQSGNPKGRPKGSKNKFSVTKMQEALEREALKAGYTSTYDYVAKQFFKDNHVLTAMMKKMLADLKSIEQVVTSVDPVGDRKRSLAIEQKLAERMKLMRKRFETK